MLFYLDDFTSNEDCLIYNAILCIFSLLQSKGKHVNQQDVDFDKSLKKEKENE